MTDAQPIRLPRVGPSGRSETRAAIDRLRHEARGRSFGLADADRRAAVRHGYLLAIEDIKRELRGLESW